MSRIGKRAVFKPEVIERAKSIVSNLSYGDEVISAVSVLMAGVLSLTGEQISSVLGISIPTVVRMNARFRKAETKQTNNWGGDRRPSRNAEVEKEVLDELTEQSIKGEIVLAQQVKKAIEERLGKSISVQTAYNILHRGGWRKVMPDKIHPKCDPEKQEEFKKKYSQRHCSWQPSPPKQKIAH